MQIKEYNIFHAEFLTEDENKYNLEIGEGLLKKSLKIFQLKYTIEKLKPINSNNI